MTKNPNFLRYYSSTMLCTAVVTLGAGFVAWWRGRRLEQGDSPTSS